MKTSESITRMRIRAVNNIEKWGYQDKNTLILAMIEELGELAQAYLQHKTENGDHALIGEEAVTAYPQALR